MPAKAANVPSTACVTMPSPNCASNTLLIAPRATPSAAANSSTRAGLMERLNELTSDRRNAAPAPTIESVRARPHASWLTVLTSMMSPIHHHVANAVAKTSAMEMAVFCTTESTVIRPPEPSTWPGVSP